MYTNRFNLPLSTAVWLAHDSYDHNADPTHISATSLIKGLRQIVLERRLQTSEPIDISSLVPSSMGTAIHDGIEAAWVNNYQNSLASLGVPQKIIDRVRINPDPDTVTTDCIPVYLEQRIERELEGFKVSGKFDFVGEGRVEDFKTTSTFTYMNKTNDEKYQLQGSIYRWLNPNIITQDEMAIQFIFTDWSALRAATEKAKGYPQLRTLEYRLPLLSLTETEQYIKRKLIQIKQLESVPEENLPYCSDIELWRKPPVYKYYKDPSKRARSTKNFDNLMEANIRLAKDGGSGVVVETKGDVGACKYCAAFSICSQKDTYIRSGELKI